MYLLQLNSTCIYVYINSRLSLKWSIHFSPWFQHNSIIFYFKAIIVCVFCICFISTIWKKNSIPSLAESVLSKTKLFKQFNQFLGMKYTYFDVILLKLISLLFYYIYLSSGGQKESYFIFVRYVFYDKFHALLIFNII